MKKIQSKLLNETYYYTKLENGLSVYLVPKKDYYKTYAIFATHYGSLDQEFIPIDRDEFCSTPLGVAHFLEHKVFECENGEDAVMLFADLGNDANAFTTYDTTAYLFSGTDKIKESIEVLLDFVQTPYFNERSVEKEKSIIEQELLMYMDRPKVVAHMGVLNNLFKKNLIRNDVGGTVDSIKKINVDVLKQCYKSFYHPGNMVLSIVGNIDVEEIKQIIINNQSQKSFPPYKNIIRKYYPESHEAYRKESTDYLDVTIPKITIGMKFGYLKIPEMMKFKYSCILDILMDIYFSNSSNLYLEMQKDNIIDNSYDYEYYYESTYGYLMISCDTNEEQEFIHKVINTLIKIHDLDIKEEEFIRYKRVNESRVISRFNSLEYIANVLVDFHFEGIELFDAIEIMNNITLEDVVQFRKYFVEEAICIHKILPLANKNK